MIHLSEIDVLLLETTDIVLTTMLIKRLVDENILLLFCDDKRLPIAKLLPFYGKHDSSLQIFKQINWNEQIKQDVWTKIISQKILNQSSFLKHTKYFDKSDSILYLHDGLQVMDPTNREGHAARIYFNTLFGNDFSRSDENDINNGLNYGYTMLMSMVARDIVKNGCLTQLGLKHTNQFNGYNLASDLMEPFRCLVDDIVYNNRKCEFKIIKRHLFELFSNTFVYGNQNMYLTNIISDYTKKVVKLLNNGGKGMPEFRI